LKAAAGQSIAIEIKDEKTGEILERRMPRIMDMEKPPSPEAARRNWKTARSRFFALKKEISKDLEDLERIRALCLATPALRAAKAEAESALNEARQTLTLAEHDLASETDAAFSAKRHLDDKTLQRNALLPLRPGFFSRLFRTRRWKAWESDYRQRLDDENSARRMHSVADAKVMAATRLRDNARNECTKCSEVFATKAGAHDNAQSQIDRQRAAHGDILIDETFAGKSHEDRHLVPPWLPTAVHRKREDLFVAALSVQRAFIDVAAQKILHNISILFSDAAAIASDSEKKHYLGDLWSTLFAVVPVISTTFASIDRMIGHLPANSIGWLLVDEAGQATPQAAIGALMRSKRAVVVGDPLQIPPVISLPEQLNSKIAAYFSVSRSRWTAPEASVQTLADHASRFVGAFDTDKGVRQVGVPLLVHRRCRNPMFDISNAIAYDRQMVFATPARPIGHVRKCLGASCWIDVVGEAQSKWCPAEADTLVKMLDRLATAGIVSPDIFIISPFRIVADEMRRRIERERVLMQSLGASAYEWARDRVGTIHTFQGREADTVFLVLGAPNDSQTGARNWATSSPNILNVAVSRAKENLYVIGSRAAWSGTGCAREVANALPPMTAK